MSLLARLSSFLEKQPPLFHILMGWVLTILAGVADKVEGPDVTLTPLYLMPAALVTWFAGRRAGFLVLPMTVVSWIVFHSPFDNFSINPWVRVWNIAVRAGFVVLTILLFSRLKTDHENEKKLARTDALTGLANVRALAELGQAEIERARRTGRPFTLAFMDIDHFKRVNDRSGHSVGDKVLAEISRTLRAKLRSFDILARIGGDEFVLILPEVEMGSAEVVLTRVQSSLLALGERRGWPIGFSIGALVCRQPSASLDELINLADQYMYESKDSSGNHVHVRVLDNPGSLLVLAPTAGEP